MTDIDDIVTTTDIVQGWERESVEEGIEHGSAEDQGLLPEQQQGSNQGRD
jgi:hypothetical protein